MQSLKRTILIILVFSSSFSHAQKRIDVKYYHNNTKLPVDNVRIFIVARLDTIDLKIEKGTIRISKKLKDNFTLYSQFEGKTMKIGSFRPATFNGFNAIIIGRITDFSEMKRHYSNDNAFCIAGEYWINVPNSQHIEDFMYAMAGDEIDISANSNFTSYFPTVTGSYEVIKTKG